VLGASQGCAGVACLGAFLEVEMKAAWQEEPWGVQEEPVRDDEV